MHSLCVTLNFAAHITIKLIPSFCFVFIFSIPKSIANSTIYSMNDGKAILFN